MDLLSEKVSLRKLNENDAPVLARLLNNKKIWNNLRDKIPFPYSEDDAKEFIGWCQAEDPPMTFGIDYKGELVGCVGLLPQADVYRLSAEVGYWIGEPYWGKGITTKAVKLIVDYGFTDLNLVKIFTGVFDFNKASQRVLEKNSFKLECVSEKALIKNGEIRDEYRYGLVNEEYK